MPPERAAHLAAGRIAGVQDSPGAVRPLDRQRRLTIRTEIEPRAPRHQFADAVRALFDERAHGGFVAESVAGSQRVGQVKRGRIIRADCGGNASLGVSGVALVGLGLGEDEDVARAAQSGRGSQRGDAAADDEVAGGDAAILPSA